MSVVGASMAERVGANVRAEMARLLCTQAELAEQLGISQAAVSMRLNGRVSFDVNELAAVAEFLQVGISDLIPTT